MGETIVLGVFFNPRGSDGSPKPRGQEKWKPKGPELGDWTPLIIENMTVDLLGFLELAGYEQVSEH